MRPGARLAARLGLPVRDLDLIERALVHSSYLHEHPDEVHAHNERLEFLGDSVINLAISEALFARHPLDDEGTLSARRAAIVSTTGLARLASRINLGEDLLLGEGEAARSGRRRPSLLASALEALTGAIYRDQGFSTAREWILALAAPEIAADLPIGTLKSPKSRLQELTQRHAGMRPTYHVLEASGPDHERYFRIEALLHDRVLGVGEGASRRQAETDAATQALAAMADADGLGGSAAPIGMRPADLGADRAAELAEDVARSGGSADAGESGSRPKSEPAGE